MSGVRATPDPHAQLNAVQRRRRWKLAVQSGGILLIAVGVVLLPIRADTLE